MSGTLPQESVRETARIYSIHQADLSSPNRSPGISSSLHLCFPNGYQEIWTSPNNFLMWSPYHGKEIQFHREGRLSVGSTQAVIGHYDLLDRTLSLL